MTHHGDEHVDEDDDDGHVVDGKQHQSYRLDEARGSITGYSTSWRRGRVKGTAAGAADGRRLGRVRDNDTVSADLAEHAPEQTIERHRHSTATSHRNQPQSRDHRAPVCQSVSFH